MGTMELKDIFLDALLELDMDKRYAHLIEDKPAFVIKMMFHFLDIMSDQRVKRIMLTLREHDFTTYIHSVDLFVLAGLFGIATDEKHHAFLRGALLHDIGKLHIVSEVLIKRDRLTESEYDDIKTHAAVGSDILLGFGYHYEATIARSHHERLDGSGYPDKLMDTEMNNHIRLIGMLDVYSALTLKRPYKKAMTNKEALEIIGKDNRQYDKEVVEQFTKKLTLEKSTIY